MFFEGATNLEFTRRLARMLATEVHRLTPHLVLNVVVQQATLVEPWSFEWSGQRIEVVKHAPRVDGHQSLLVTDRDLGAHGWGTETYSVVSKPAMIEKNARGGDPVDIAIHEWIHTIEGTVINGRAVPFVDDAEKCGFAGETGADGEPRWTAWYRYCLGAS
jgi:hypothetical protein